MSNHHNLVITALKTQFQKGSRKITFYGNYKNFEKQNYSVLIVSKMEDFLSF